MKVTAQTGRYGVATVEYAGLFYYSYLKRGGGFIRDTGKSGLTAVYDSGKCGLTVVRDTGKYGWAAVSYAVGGAGGICGAGVPVLKNIRSKWSNRFPFGAGYAGTEIGVHGKDRIEQPPSRIAPVAQNQIVWHHAQIKYDAART